MTIFTVWAMKNVSLFGHVINWHFLLFIVTIFIFICFLLFERLKMFCSYVTLFIRFFVVYRDYFCFCICFLPFELFKMFCSYVTLFIRFSCCLLYYFCFCLCFLLFERWNTFRSVGRLFIGVFIVTIFTLWAIKMFRSLVTWFFGISWYLSPSPLPAPGWQFYRGTSSLSDYWGIKAAVPFSYPRLLVCLFSHLSSV